MTKLEQWTWWDGQDVAIVALWDRGRKPECREPAMLAARGSLLPLSRALTMTAYALSTGHGRRRLR